MVDISDFKDEKKQYLSVMDVMNATDRTAIITGEAVIGTFTAKQSGNEYKKLIIPVDFNGKSFLLTVYADVGSRLALSMGRETRDWVGRHLMVKIAGAQRPYLTVEVL